MFPPPAPKAEANGKWKDLELLTEGLVLVTEVVMVFWACVKDGPPPTPILALAGTVKFSFSEKATKICEICLMVLTFTKVY